jgi:general secretion pathway protein L
MTRLNNLVEWHADKEIWMITCSTNDSIGRAADQTIDLEKWAEEQAELAPVSLLLSANNYAASWVSLPGVKGRHVNRALPFALEDMLIGDISDYTIIPSGSVAGRHKAYLVASDLVDRLLEVLALHHVRLVSLVPETALLVSGNIITRSNDDWLVSLPGRIEGRLPDSAIPALLESVANSPFDGVLSLSSPSRDQANLLKSTIATGYPEAFDDIEISTTSAFSEDSDVNLLQGRVLSASEENKPAAWWRGIAAFAAFFAIMSVVYLSVANHQLTQKVDQVSDASLTLYKRWFPGERTSNYEALFRRKLRGENTTESGAGFVTIMSEVAHAWGGGNAKASIEVQSIRYSERMGEFLLDVTAKEQGDLQVFKQALEARGLTAEISSATADKGVFKGRVKVGGAA